jgi:hypothetical protein
MQLNTSDHKKYIWKKTKFPKHLLHNNESPADQLFHNITQAQDKTNKRKIKEMDWISEETYNLFQWKTMARKNGNTRNAQRLSLLLKKSLQHGQNQITQTAVTEQFPIGISPIERLVQDSSTQIIKSNQH